MNLISIAQAFDQWESEIRPQIEAQYGADDRPALSESWNDYTDALARDGRLTDLQYRYCPPYDGEIPAGVELHDDALWLLGEMGVRISSERIDARPDGFGDDWDAAASHWRVTIRRGRNSLRVCYSMGSAHRGRPRDLDILFSILSDANGVEDMDFEEWAAEYGCDTDSRKAERTYKACKRTAAGLARLFAADELEDLRELLEDY